MKSMDVVRLAFIYAKQAEIEGMKSENIDRESKGYTLAYDDNSFCSMAKELREIATCKDHELYDLN